MTKTKTTKSQIRELVARIRRGLAPNGKKLASRETTAKALRCSPGSVYNWENGLAAPGTRALHELSKAATDLERRSTRKTPGVDPATDADRLSNMLRAISACGDLESARATFERAMTSLS